MILRDELHDFGLLISMTAADGVTASWRPDFVHIPFPHIPTNLKPVGLMRFDEQVSMCFCLARTVGYIYSFSARFGVVSI